jgi:hypothetical protein
MPECRMTARTEGAGDHRYVVFGLCLSSEIAIPELSLAAGDGGRAPDVEIRLGDVPPLADAVDILGLPMTFSKGRIGIELKDTARFEIIEGREILVSPCDGADEAVIRIFLLGTVLGAVCHQRALFPLHANAIEIDGRAYAFCGLSGAGKSTLAAHFQQQGYRLLCDDVCVISFDESGKPLAWPGIPRLKLWEDTIASLGRSQHGLSSVGWGLNKYHMPIESYAIDGPYPLKNVYWLDYESERRASGIYPLAGLDAVDALMANTYRRRVVELIGGGPYYLKQVQSLIRHCGIFAAIRKRGFEFLADEAEAIGRHMGE